MLLDEWFVEMCKLEVCVVILFDVDVLLEFLGIMENVYNVFVVVFLFFFEIDDIVDYELILDWSFVVLVEVVG